MRNEKVKEAEAFTRHLFLEQPWLTIDEAARIAAEKHLGLTKPAIARIRHEVRARVGKSMSGGTLPVQQQAQPRRLRIPAPFNPPKLVLLSNENEQPKETDVAKKEKPTTKDKAKWLDGWLEKNPYATIKQAQGALRKHFGEGMSTHYVSEVVRLAHEAFQPKEEPKQQEPEPLAEAARKPPATLPGHDEIGALVRQLKDRGIRLIAINDDGTARVELFGRF